jgi:hypothetical protein
MVTNSSAAVGWMPTVSSNCCLGEPRDHRDADALDDFRRVRPHHVGAYHLL